LVEKSAKTSWIRMSYSRFVCLFVSTMAVHVP
jgi:hypothetical protein